MRSLLTKENTLLEFKNSAGGKAYNLKRMLDAGIPVPHFVAVSTNYFKNTYPKIILKKKLVK